jgi:hypothetical protein
LGTYADGALAGDGSEYPHLGRRQSVGYVLLEVAYLAHLDAAPEPELVAGHPRTDDGPDHLRLHAEG